MRGKVNEIMERKKNLLQKQTKAGRRNLNQNKRRIEGADPDEKITKQKYAKEISRLTDRFVPILLNFKDLECLLSELPAELKVEKGVVKLIRNIKSDNEKTEQLVINIKILSVDEGTDCLQFSVE